MIREYTLDYLQQLLLKSYGLQGEIKELAGYTDRNYSLKVEKNGTIQKFIIKISSSLENRHLIELQSYVFRQIEEQIFQLENCKLPKLIPTLEHQDMMIIEGQEGSNYIRVLTFIEGSEIWELEDAPLHLFSQAGSVAARLSLFLQKISNKQQINQVILNQQSENHYFNICTLNSHYEKYQKCLDQKLKATVDQVKEDFNQNLPLLKSIPKQILHNDICLSNLLVSEEQENGLFSISGLIDFSSMIYSYRIIELVILCARINLFSPQPLRNILCVIVAYNKVRKLSEVEKQLLFPLIKVRLAFLGLLSSFLASQRSHDPYFTKCKNSHILYLQTIGNFCSNEEFLSMLESQLSHSQ